MNLGVLSVTPSAFLISSTSPGFFFNSFCVFLILEIPLVNRVLLVFPFQFFLETRDLLVPVRLGFQQLVLHSPSSARPVARSSINLVVCRTPLPLPKKTWSALETRNSSPRLGWDRTYDRGNGRRRQTHDASGRNLLVHEIHLEFRHVSVVEHFGPMARKPVATRVFQANPPPPVPENCGLSSLNDSTA